MNAATARQEVAVSAEIPKPTKGVYAKHLNRRYDPECSYSVIPIVRKFVPEQISGPLEGHFELYAKRMSVVAIEVWELWSFRRDHKTGVVPLTIQTTATIICRTIDQVKYGIADLKDAGLVCGKWRRKKGKYYYQFTCYGCTPQKALKGTGKCVIPLSAHDKLIKRHEVHVGGTRPGAGRPTNTERTRRTLAAATGANDNASPEIIKPHDLRPSSPESPTILDAYEVWNGSAVGDLNSSSNQNSASKVQIEIQQNTRRIRSESETITLHGETITPRGSSLGSYQIPSKAYETLSESPATECFQSIPNGMEENSRLRFTTPASFSFLDLGIGVLQATQSDPSPKGVARNAKGSTMLGARETGARGVTRQRDAREALSIEDRKKLWPEKHPLIPADYYCYDLDDGRVRSFIRTILRGGSRSVLDAYVSGALDAK